MQNVAFLELSRSGIYDGIFQKFGFEGSDTGGVLKSVAETYRTAALIIPRPRLYS